MDRGIWATWYDLPERGKDEYISWLHESHIPRMLCQPGYLWGAHIENIWDEKREQRKARRLTHTQDPNVPTGNAYLMLFGAPFPTVFLDPSPAQLVESLNRDDREMLSRRVGVRSCIFMERARVDGSESASRRPGLTPGPAIQMGSFNINGTENENEIGSWYAQLRNPRLKKMAGCVGARNLVSVSGWPKHSVLYEWVSIDSLRENFTSENVDRTEEAVAKLIHAPGSPTLGNRIWPPIDSL